MKYLLSTTTLLLAFCFTTTTTASLTLSNLNYTSSALAEWNGMSDSESRGFRADASVSERGPDGFATIYASSGLEEAEIFSLPPRPGESPDSRLKVRGFVLTETIETFDEQVPAPLAVAAVEFHVSMAVDELTAATFSLSATSNENIPEVDLQIFRSDGSVFFQSTSSSIFEELVLEPDFYNVEMSAQLRTNGFKNDSDNAEFIQFRIDSDFSSNNIPEPTAFLTWFIACVSGTHRQAAALAWSQMVT